MTVYEIEIDLLAKVLVPATDEAAAKERWHALLGATIDLRDKRWIEVGHTHPFRILGEMRIAAVRKPDGPLRQVSKTRLNKAIDTAPTRAEGFIQPISDNSAVPNAFKLTVAFTAATFIAKQLRSSLQDMIEEPPRTFVDLENASEYWLSMVGFESDAFPMVISRQAVIGGLSSQMLRPKRNKSGRLVDMHAWS